MNFFNTNKVRITVLVLVLAMVFLPISLIKAQEDPKLQTTENTEKSLDNQSDVTVDGTLGENKVISPFDIELVVGTQSPWTKKVPVTVKIRPSQDTTRTNVTWDYPVGINLKDPNSTNYEAIPQGQVWSYTVKVDPIVSGTYTIAATATDWGYGSNFASSISTDITFNDNLVATPAQTNYSTAVTIRYVIITLLFLLVCAIAYIFGRTGLKKLKQWLKPPEL